MSLVKYRLKEVAADFELPVKEISEIISKFFEKPKSNTQVLTEEELNVVFDYVTKTHQIDSLEQVFAVQPKKVEPPKVPEKPKAEAPRPRERKLKFSFKEEREFATIDDELAELEAKLDACRAEQGRCGSDYVKLQQLTDQQTELEAALEEKMERWVYLNELKEKIDAQ